MTKALYRRDYLQPRCIHGYQLSSGFCYDTNSTHDDVISWRSLNGSEFLISRDYTFYNPMVNEPGLHRILVATEMTGEAIVEFCNLYGALWEPWDLFATSMEETGFHREGKLYGYRLHDYFCEVSKLRDAIETFDVLMDGRTECIRAFCERKHPFEHNKNWLADDCSSIPIGYLYAHMNEGICIAVEAGLQRNDVTPQMVISRDAGEGHFCAVLLDAVKAGMKPEEVGYDWVPDANRYKSDYCLSSRNGMELVFRPQNLAGTLWLMLAYEITGVKTYHQCPACGDWFEISELGDSRISKVYCDENCRARAYRRRKKLKTLSV